MKIKKRIGDFFWKTRKVRHKNENLVLMISMYYFVTVILFLAFSISKWNTEGVNLAVDFFTLIILYIVYKKTMKNDFDLRFWAECEDDLKYWEKRKMTLKIFLVLFILTTAKGVIATSVMDFIYAIKGVQNPTLPGSVEHLGASPSVLIRAIILGPIIEEIIFRAAGLSLFRKKDNKLEAIIFTGFVFGFMHANLAQAINSTIGGFIYAYIAIEFGVKYSVLFHMINNGMVYVEYFLNIENLMDIASIMIVIILLLTCMKKFIEGLKQYANESQKYSIKRQLLYFCHPSLILFMGLWLIAIILSV